MAKRLYHKIEIVVSTENLDEGDIGELFDYEVSKLAWHEPFDVEDLVAYQITGPLKGSW